MQNKGKNINKQKKVYNFHDFFGKVLPMIDLSYIFLFLITL